MAQKMTDAMLDILMMALIVAGCAFLLMIVGRM